MKESERQGKKYERQDQQYSTCCRPFNTATVGLMSFRFQVAWNLVDIKPTWTTLNGTQRQ